MPGVGLNSVTMAFPWDGDCDIFWSAWALSKIMIVFLKDVLKKNEV